MRVEMLVDDLRALLDALGIDKVRLVAHDWGAVIGWRFVLAHPQRVERFVALSVGHPTAYARGGLVQKLKGYYVLLMQLRGIMEWLAMCGDWFLFRQLTRYAAEFPRWRERLSRPGRLTAGELASARVPVFGVWSSGDLFLVEGQMIASERYVRGPWRYARIEGANHWLQLDAPQHFNPLLLEYLGLPREFL